MLGTPGGSQHPSRGRSPVPRKLTRASLLKSYQKIRLENHQKPPRKTAPQRKLSTEFQIFLSRVYARACRGNPDPQRPNHGSSRSIPAHAGEPRSGATMGAVIGVYPRACGGTAPLPVSPGEWKGSIPAHAGEPPRWPPRATSPRVYPRACGGGGTRVYPRACGGTSYEWLIPQKATGLSPRMRGNRQHLRADARDHGSIPAHAGEPSAISGPQTRKVYPRACGGTQHRRRR